MPDNTPEFVSSVLRENESLRRENEDLRRKLKAALERLAEQARLLEKLT